MKNSKKKRRINEKSTGQIADGHFFIDCGNTRIKDKEIAYLKGRFREIVEEMNMKLTSFEVMK